VCVYSGDAADATTAMIIAIAVGVDALIIIIIMVAVMVCCFRAKKRYELLKAWILTL